MGMPVDPYAAIAEFYDLEHAELRDDISFYLQAIPSGPVLEVGVGSGRIMLPLLEAGHEVWGVDISPDMLERARERTSQFPGAHLIRSSALNLDAGVLFETALLPLNTLWHMDSQNEQVQTLNSVCRHLVSGGTLIVDLSNPYTMADSGAWGELRERFARGGAEGFVTAWSAAWDDKGAQTLKLSLTYDRIRDDGVLRRTRTEMAFRYLHAPELSLMLRLAGFGEHRVYGSYTLDAYDAASPNIIAIAHRD